MEPTSATVEFLSLERECEHLAEEFVELEGRHFALLNAISEGIVVTQDGVNRFANRALCEITGWTLDEIVEMPSFLNTVLPAGTPQPPSGLETPIADVRSSRGESRIQCKDGTTKDVEMVMLNVPYDHRDASMTVIRDITEYRRIEVALLESEEKFRVILDSATTPIVYYDLNGYILLINTAGAAMMGGSPDEITGRRVHDIFPTEGKAILKRVLRVAEREEGAEYEDNVRLPSGERWFLSRFEPVRDVQSSIFAVQTISYDVTPHRQLAEAWRELSRKLVEVQEQERRHIASELHDQIGQSLTGLRMMFGRVLTEPDVANQKLLSEAQQLLDELLDRVRQLSLDLRPSMLDDLGLVPSLLWLFDRYMAQTGVRVKFKRKGLDQPIAHDVTTAAYRIIQESLTNVARHASVDTVSVWLLADPDTLTVHVHDEGAGFDLDSVRSSGPSSGLVGMRERAIALGGHLKVTSAPEQGTDVIARLPLSSEDGAQG